MSLLYCALYIAAIGIASHFIGNAFPRRWFHPEKYPYRSADWEREGQIYTRLGVRRWKDKVPDMSKVCGDMVRKKIVTRPTAESLQVLIRESCVAECVHVLLTGFSLPVVFLWPGAGGWIVWVLCVVGNLVYVVIQRYNRPRLQKMLRRLENQGSSD